MAQGLAGRRAIGLDERLAERGRDHVLLGFRDVGLGVAHPMNPAPLPGRAHDAPDRRLETLVRVGDHQLGAAQATADQALQERGPEGLRLRGPDVQADDLALALDVDRHGDYRGDAGDPPALALLEVGGVQPA